MHQPALPASQVSIAPSGMDAIERLFRLATAALPVSAMALQVSGSHIIYASGIDAREASRLTRSLNNACATTGQPIHTLQTAPAEKLRHAAIAHLSSQPAGVGCTLFVFGTAEQGSLGPTQVRLLADLIALAEPQICPALSIAGSEPASDAIAGTDLLFRDAMQALPEAIALFDNEDRFVFWNRKFEDIYSHRDAPVEIGKRFEDHLRESLRRGSILDAVGREEEWLAERMARFKDAAGAHEIKLKNGRWVRVQDRILPHGGRIGIRTEVTDLVNRENSFRLLFEANPTPMLVIDRDSLAILAVNSAAVNFYGHSRETLLQSTLPDILPESEAHKAAGIADRLDNSDAAGKPSKHILANGEERLVKINARLIDHDGHAAILAAVFDVTERQRMEEEVRRTRSFLRHVVDHIPTALFVKDMHDGGRYVLYNKAGQDIFGFASADVLGNTDDNIFDPERTAYFARQDEQTMELGGLDVTDEFIPKGGDGTPRSIRTRKVALRDSSNNKPRYVLGIAEDVTEQRNNEARIAHMAHHDALTGLANRLLFRSRLDAAIAGLAASPHLLAVFFVDLDGFKAVNDTFGHAAGDALLKTVSERLNGTLRSSDTVARFGGDEFAVLATVAQTGEAAWIAARLVSALSTPYAIAGKSVKISASIGVSLAPQDGLNPEALMASADAALYSAKRAGKNRFQFAKGLVDMTDLDEIPRGIQQNG
jgi:diguanylate cyclase (GGDEF)-like protein/PAS domain S-box-containing protein